MGTALIALAILWALSEWFTALKLAVLSRRIAKLEEIEARRLRGEGWKRGTIIEAEVVPPDGPRGS
jgi:hypothetical protein